MDCVPVLVNGRIEVTEPRRLKKGDQVICGRTENCEDGIYLYPDGTVRQVYFYCVDISEFTVNKLTDRGSLAAHGIVTNVQDFIVNISKGLGL